MSRRKQTNPQHIEDDDCIAVCLQNGTNSGAEVLGPAVDEHICGRCRADFAELCDFLQHKKLCARKRLVLLVAEEMADFEDSDGSEDRSDDERPKVKRKTDPAGPVNLSRFSKDCLKRTLVTASVSVTSNLPHQFPLSIPDTHVALEALQNTRVAVAQHGHTSRATELGALQSALYTLQQQQLLQLQIIQQLHAHILGNPSQGPLPTLSTSLPPLTGTAALTPPQSNDSSAGAQQLNVAPPKGATGTSVPEGSPKHSLLQTAVPPPLPPQEPNTLELLQRHTEQALQNTMSGGSFLLNGVSGSGGDLSRLKKSCDGKDEALFRHRCKFCGKVFGSDSALQIHVRSHTGERPFKCNICGNRFSTKGNLKVHFQRHRAKYPHIRMNPHPVPEHLDALHPPLEKPGADGQLSEEPGEDQTSTPMDVSGGSVAEDLSLKNGRETPSDADHRQAYMQHHRSRSVSPNNASNMSGASDNYTDGSILDDNLEVDMKMEGDQDSMGSSMDPGSPGNNDDDIQDEEDLMMQKDEELKRSLVSARFSSFSPFSSGPLNFPSLFQHSPFASGMPNPQFNFSGLSCVTSTPTTSTVTTSNPNDPNGAHTDPAFYQDLLPKPGSTDNSWESLMEVTKASETSKLQQLVDNIENKLSDPNQCIICHRVLSCKSALQMHYRTHTGERPFKCKICGRAFTTKGNLKTHMGVHRVKPPLRVLHQCPVCHKQFTNSLVLQQHIRMHTGEPTDMLPEQIMASEIKALPMLPTSTMLPAIMAPPSSDETAPTCDERPQSHSPVSNHSPTPSTESVIKAPDSAKENVSTTDDRESVSPRPSSPLPPELTCVKEEESPPPPPPNNPTYSRDSPIRHLSPGYERSIPMSMHHPTFTTSLAALENHVKTINTSIPQPLPFGPFGVALPVSGFPRYDDPISYMNRSHPMEYSMARDKSPSSVYSSSPTTSRAPSEGSADERSTPGTVSKSEHFSIPSTTVMTSTPRSEGALDLTPRASVLSATPTSSTPSPEIDTRIFSSPLGGLPFHPIPGRPNTTCRICLKTFACNSALEIHYRSHTKERPFKCDVCDRGFSTKGNMKQHMLTHKIRDLPSQLFTTSPTPVTPTMTDSQSSSQDKPDSVERCGSERCSNACSPALNQLPKRPPGMPKHMCHICNKPFSSASALQIHMRTHTGDKPFKCSICGRAFTTKGNLKVHMGTHMWNNGSSRRGRRMSLDLPPLPLPPGKPGEMVLHRPDLYFQYFNPAYLNGGMGQPKTNEISVIQTAGLSNGNGPMSMPPQLSPQQLTMAQLSQPPRTSASLMHGFRPSLTTTASVTSPSNCGPEDLIVTSRNGEYHYHQHHHHQHHHLHNQQQQQQQQHQQCQQPPLIEEDKKCSTPPPPPPPVTTRFGDTAEGVASPPAVPEGASWGWKISCNLCPKICTSSDDLEVHLKTHYKEEPSLMVEKAPENLAA